jgi:hypothetical protein
MSDKAVLICICVTVAGKWRYNQWLYLTQQPRQLAQNGIIDLRTQDVYPKS